MQEQVISFETAKLAKEKGSPFYGGKCYYQNKIWAMETLARFSEGTLDMGICFPALTQSLLQKWLRESKKINVLIDFDGVLYDAKILHNDEIINLISTFHETPYTFITYEEALEEGLKVGLELIKN